MGLYDPVFLPQAPAFSFTTRAANASAAVMSISSFRFGLRSQSDNGANNSCARGGGSEANQDSLTSRVRVLNAIAVAGTLFY